MTPLMQLTGRGLSSPLTLFGATFEGGKLTAQGYCTTHDLRKSRVLKDQYGIRYRLTTKLESYGGRINAVGLGLSTPITLEVL